MRVLLQRVTKASVTIDEVVTAAVGPGLVLLVGVTHGDGPEEAKRLALKVAHLRIFEDLSGKFNRSLLDTGGEVLVVSQFTLYADTRKGRRPSFTGAARPEQAEPLVDIFAETLRVLGATRVATGRFGASMLVEIHNAGPVTIMLESDSL
jgi:D-tyrosyl-tRNA(Tyr) deacylase